MRDYELALVLPGGLTPAKKTTILDKIEKEVAGAGGKLGKVEEAGKKELAYSIKKEIQGLFFYAPLSLQADKVRDLDRMLIVDEGILRHLLTKIDSKVQSSNAKSSPKPKVKKQ